eukprot:279933_1
MLLKRCFHILWCLALCISGQYLDTTSMNNGCGNFKYPNIPFNQNNIPSLIQQSFKEIDFYLDTLYQTYQIPSISFGIVYNQQLIHYKSIGLSNLSNPNSKPTPDTIYGIGSVSKVFTTLLTYILRDTFTNISLHDPLYKFNNNFTINNSWGITDVEKLGQTITLKQLISQISGMFRQSPCLISCTNYTTSQILTELKNLYLIHPTSTQSSYSNLAYALVGNILSEYLGANYENTLQKYLLNPLNLQFTGVYLKDLINQSYTAAVPYSMDHKQYSTYKDLGWESPAGGLFSTINNLAAVMQQFFASIPGTFEFELNEHYNFITSPQSLRDMLLPVFMNPDMKSGFGSPWEMNILNGHLLRGKGGNINGFAADLQMVSEMRLGVIALSNFEIDASIFTLGTLEILMPVFKAWIMTQKLEYKPLYPIGYNIKSYVGNYYFLNELVFIIESEIINGNEWLFLIAPLSYGGRYGSLTWMGKDNTTFVFSNFQQNRESCWDISLLGIDGDTLEFVIVGNDVVGVMSPDMNWEMVFVKGKTVDKYSKHKRIVFQKRLDDGSKDRIRIKHQYLRNKALSQHVPPRFGFSQHLQKSHKFILFKNTS